MRINKRTRNRIIVAASVLALTVFGFANGSTVSLAEEADGYTTDPVEAVEPTPASEPTESVEPTDPTTPTITSPEEPTDTSTNTSTDDPGRFAGTANISFDLENPETIKFVPDGENGFNGTLSVEGEQCFAIGGEDGEVRENVTGQLSIYKKGVDGWVFVYGSDVIGDLNSMPDSLTIIVGFGDWLYRGVLCSRPVPTTTPPTQEPVYPVSPVINYSTPTPDPTVAPTQTPEITPTPTATPIATAEVQDEKVPLTEIVPTDDETEEPDTVEVEEKVPLSDDVTDETPETGDPMDPAIPVAGMGMSMFALFTIVMYRRKRSELKK